MLGVHQANFAAVNASGSGYFQFIRFSDKLKLKVEIILTERRFFVADFSSSKQFSLFFYKRSKTDR